MTDFRVVALEYEVNGENYVFHAAEVHYEAATVGPENPLVLIVDIPELVPNVGVIYKDRNGVEQSYALTFSGLDGSVLLTKQPLK